MFNSNRFKMAANIYNIAVAQFAQAQTRNIKTSKITLNNHQLHLHLIRKSHDCTTQNNYQLHSSQKRKKKKHQWLHEFWRKYTRASYFTPRVCQMQTAFRRVPALKRFNVNIGAMNYLHVLEELLIRRPTNAINCCRCADDVQFTRTHETLTRDLRIVRDYTYASVSKGVTKCIETRATRTAVLELRRNTRPRIEEQQHSAPKQTLT